ncbi:MAG: HD-GYP domain-containing protein [Acetivibrio sp.]
MRLVSIDMLTSDMTLAIPVYCKDALVIPEGRNHIDKYIPNLNNMGIQYVYIEDVLSKDIIIPDAISTKTRNVCKSILRSTLLDYTGKNELKIYKITNSLEHVILEILQNQDVQVSLNDIGTLDEETYVHSVNVAIYSLLMGKALNYSKKRLEELAMGTILHDIGKTLIEPKLQFKKGRFSASEFAQMKKHAEMGYYILEKGTKLPEETKRIALNHHERMDGSGYPSGLKGEELNEFEKIVMIADVYDSLISSRCYKKKWPIAKAVDFLIEKAGTLFSPELVQLFIQQIAIYPNGSMVLLSDGNIGIVKEQNRHVPMRPIIRIFKNAKGVEITPFEVDLMEVLSVTIVDSQLEITEYQKNRAGLLGI